MTENITVLTTGAAGFVGSHVVAELLKDGHQVIAVDNCVNAIEGREGRKPPSLERTEELTGREVNFYSISLLDRPALDKVFSKHKIDIVIHFAALKAVGQSVEQPLRYYQNNITGTVNLLEAMDAAGCKRLIFSSSATVYGDPQYLPMDENHPTGQGITNPYGQTKYMCEQIMKDVTVADKDLRVILLRYFNPVGAHESGRIGEHPCGVPNNLMPFITQVAVGLRPVVSVFGGDYDTKDGTGVRDYLHVVDLAKGHLAGVDKIFSNDFRTGWKAYNLGTGKGISVLEMIREFEKTCGRPIPHKIVDRRQGDVPTMLASPELANKELNWKAEKSLHDMCADSWRWQNQNPDGYGQN